MRADTRTTQTASGWLARRSPLTTRLILAAGIATLASSVDAQVAAVTPERVVVPSAAAVATSAKINVPHATDDAYAVPGASLVVSAGAGLLANDSGAPLTIVSHSDPLHGTLALNPDGSFRYTPAPGYVGPDSFTYVTSDAVQLYPMRAPPLGTFGGVSIQGDGYGSSLYPVPGAGDEAYGLTDRGPNVYLPDGTVVEPIPAFQPAIGKFRLSNGEATLEQSIPLADASGAPDSGRVNSENPAGQRIFDLAGTVLATDPNGYDTEGLVALPDGTFWVSDEYGPFIVHFNAVGRQIGRLSPFDGSLPRELGNRVPNRGLEGLTLTPDGSTLVAIMQSALHQPDLGSTDALTIAIVRIVTYALATGELHEYLYLLDDPATNKTAVSEIAALSNTTFVVDERDGNYPPGAYKKLWRIDLRGATDVGPNSTVAGASYDAARGGLLIGGHTLEALLVGQGTRASAATLGSHGITAVSKTLALDLGALLEELDARGRFFSHDKIEGLFVDASGTRIILSNDSDFGIGGVANATPPFQLRAKVSPATGRLDAGEFLIVDTARLPPKLSSATVTLEVVGAPTATMTAAPTAIATPTRRPTPRPHRRRRRTPLRPQP